MGFDFSGLWASSGDPSSAASRARPFWGPRSEVGMGAEPSWGEGTRQLLLQTRVQEHPGLPPPRWGGMLGEHT